MSSRLKDKYGKNDEITANLTPVENPWSPDDPSPASDPGQTDPPPPPPRQRRRSTRGRKKAPSSTSVPTLLGRPRLSSFHWNTSRDLWDRYAAAAIQISKDESRNVSASELIRATLDANLPDLTTEEGLNELVDCSAKWQDNYARGSARHSVLLRIPEPTYQALQDARSQLESRGIALPLNLVVSALLAAGESDLLVHP